MRPVECPVLSIGYLFGKEQKKELKGKRFLLLRNEESRSTEAAVDLKKLRFEFKDLGTRSLLRWDDWDA